MLRIEGIMSLTEDAEILVSQIKFIMMYLRERNEDFLKQTAAKLSSYEKNEEARIVAIKKAKKAKKARARLNKQLRELKRGKWREFQPYELKMSLIAAVNPSNDELSLVIGAARYLLGELGKVILNLPEEIKNRYSEIAGGWHSELNSFAYYTQQGVKNYLYKRGSKAWERTCNITALAMALNSIGITQYHYFRHLLTKEELQVEAAKESYEEQNYYFYSERLHKRFLNIYCHLEKKKKCEPAFWRDEVSKLYMPNFLQIVVVEHELCKLVKGLEMEKGKKGSAAATDLHQYDDKIPSDKYKKLIDKARENAAPRISGEVKIFQELAKDFGIEQLRVFEEEPFDSLYSIGKETKAKDIELDNGLRLLLANIAKHIWTKFMLGKEIENELMDLLAAFGVREGEKDGKKSWIRRPWKKNWGDAFEEKFGSEFSFRREGERAEEWLNAHPVILALGEGILQAMSDKSSQYELMYSALFIINKPKDTETLMKDAENEGLLLGAYRETKNKNGKVVRVELGVEKLYIAALKKFYVDYPPPEVYEQFVDVQSIVESVSAVSAYTKEIYRRWKKHNLLVNRYKDTAGWDRFKAEVKRIIVPLIRNGAAVVVLRKKHYVFFKELFEDKICFSDPSFGNSSHGSRGRDSCMSWEKANRLGYFRAFHIFCHPANSDSVSKAIAQVRSLEK